MSDVLVVPTLPTVAVLDWSPEQWRDYLRTVLTYRRPTISGLLDYYEGNHPLPLAPKQAQVAYRRLLVQSRANWTQLVVDAVAERLNVVGFRFGDQASDADAWAIWQANHLDADSELVQTDALAAGVSAVMVWPDENSPVGVTITPEHPLESVVAHDRAQPRQRVAGLKEWTEIDGLLHCTLFLAEQWWEWVHDGGGWLTVVDGALNPLGAVPLVELRPWPRTMTRRPDELPGRSEMAGVLPIQDRINTTIFNRLVATEYAAFRQKYATGLVVPVLRDPETGQPVLDEQGQEQPVAPYDVAVDRLWVAEDPGVRFGEFSESDLTGYLKSVEDDIQHLAAITKTPPHYLLGAMVNVSGDALKAAETGLTKKCSRRAVHLGEAWEEVIRLSFRAVNDERADVVGAETIWADFETRSEGERVDALVKMSTLGVPRQVLWAKWGASPQEVARWETMAAAEAFTAALNAPVAPVAALPAAPAAPVPP